MEVEVDEIDKEVVVVVEIIAVVGVIKVEAIIGRGDEVTVTEAEENAAPDVVIIVFILH